MTGRETNWRRLAALGTAAVAIAVFLGWQAGSMTVDPISLPPPGRWSMPAHPAENLARDRAILDARRPWGDPYASQSGGGPNGLATSARPGSAQALQWRLAGVVERPSGNFALIAKGPPRAEHLEYRAVGDKMPDGSTLVAITAESATVEGAGAEAERRVLRLFRGAASAAGKDAAPPAGKPAAAGREGMAAPPPGTSTRNPSISLRLPPDRPGSTSRSRPVMR